jgi:uncharacterized protein
MDTVLEGTLPREASRHALRELERIVAGIGPMAVGFSGGVDSTLLLAVGRRVLGDRVLGVTTVSASLPASERREAEMLARRIGARHLFADSGEMEDDLYLENTNRRCYFCRSELFRILREVASRWGLAAIAYGAQRDDLGEFRPGMEAARKYDARAPLLEAGLGKREVRGISRLLGLPTWNKPAMACLASRVPHGVRIESALLGRIERAEEAVRRMGFRLFRVRADGSGARLELGREEMARLDDPAVRETVRREILGSGFAAVRFDPQGYRPGGAGSIRRSEAGDE